MEIRAATLSDAPAIARAHVDTWRAQYAGIVAAPFLASLSYADIEAQVAAMLAECEHKRFIYVAVQDGTIVGYAAGGPERSGSPDYPGELYAIYILPAAQRQGAGRALVRAVTGRLRSMGYLSLLIWALQDNPAREFYSALGGEELAWQPLEIGGEYLIEVAYGWADSSGLLE